MIQGLKKMEKAAPLFAGWQETMIWSCLQGVMGKIFVTSQEDPVSAMAVLGDFCFLAGKPDREFLLAGEVIKSAGPDTGSNTTDYKRRAWYGIGSFQHSDVQILWEWKAGGRMRHKLCAGNCCCGFCAAAVPVHSEKRG